MRLLRLLAAGKSLVGIKQNAGRYRPVPTKALPVFEPVPHPFRATAAPQAEVESEEPTSQEHSDGSSPAPAAKPAPALQQPVVVPADSQPTAPHCASLSQEKGKTTTTASARSRWFRWRPFGKPADTSAMPPVPRAIQGELSLDNVRPVRNDLGDSDFEVVPVKRTASVARTNPAAVAKRQESFSGAEVPKSSGPKVPPSSLGIKRMVLSGDAK